jgi:hypothetical protein
LHQLSASELGHHPGRLLSIYLTCCIPEKRAPGREVQIAGRICVAKSRLSLMVEMCVFSTENGKFAV